MGWQDWQVTTLNDTSYWSSNETTRCQGYKCVWIRGVPPLHTPLPRYLASLRGHVSAVYQIAWSADSRLLCSGSSDSTLKAMIHYMFMFSQFVSLSCDYHVTVM